MRTQIVFDWRGGFFAPIAVLLSLSYLVLAGASFVLTFNQGYPGLTVRAIGTGEWVVDNLDSSGAAALAGLAKDDEVVSVDGRATGQLASGRTRFSITAADRLMVARAGQSVESEIALQKSTPASAWDPLVLLVLSFTFCATGVAGLLVQPRDPVVRTLFFLNLAYAVGVGTAVAADRGVYWLGAIQAALVHVLPALLAHFFLVFPVRRRILFRSLPIVPWIVYLPAVVLSLLYLLAQGALPSWQETVRIAGLLNLVAGFMIAALSLVTNYRGLPAQESRQVQIVVVGTILSLLPFIFLSVVPQVILGDYILRPLTSIVFAVIMPFSFAYAILRHKLLGIDLVVVRGLVYGLLSALLLGAYAAAMWGSLWVLGAAGIQGAVDEKVIGFVLLAVAALSFGGVRDRLRAWIDQVFYQDYYDYRGTLLSLSASMSTLQQPQLLASALVTEVGRAMGLSAAALYSADQNGAPQLAADWSDDRSGVGRGLDGSENGLLAPDDVPARIELLADGTLLVPLIHGERPVGVLALGRKRSGVSFRSVDVDLLSTLASNAAMAFENARLFDEVGKAEALREMARLRDEFVSMVSHDLRAPLTPILGYAELLAHRDFRMEDVRSMARAMQGAAEQMYRLVLDLLDLSRIEQAGLRLEKTHVDLGALSEQVVAGFVVETGRHQVRVVRPKEPVLAHVDPERITQVLTNLLSNAVRYSPAGGDVELGLVEDEHLATLSVTDHGIGIPLKEREKVFEKFYRVQSPATARIKGTGLGLAVCKYMVEAHDGRIWVESELGKGSTFYVCLPLLNPAW